MKAILIFLSIFIACRATELSNVQLAIKSNNLNDIQQWYKCDDRWGSQKLGFSTQTICQAGDLMTSITMMVTSMPTWINPSMMNTWLKENKGYVNGNQFVWDSVNKFGLKFGSIDTYMERMALHLLANHFVIVNLYNQTHWAVLGGINKQGTAIGIFHPEKGTTFELMSQVRAFAWYERLRSPVSLGSWISNIQQVVELGKSFLNRQELLQKAYSLQKSVKQSLRKQFFEK